MNEIMNWVLGKIPKIMLWVTICWVVIYFTVEATKTTPDTPEKFWKNEDQTKNAWDVANLDYDTRTITYQDEVIPRTFDSNEIEDDHDETDREQLAEDLMGTGVIDGAALLEYTMD